MHRHLTHRYYLIIIMILLTISVLFSLVKGSTSLPLQQLMFDDFAQFQTIIFKLRLPRTITAFCCGAMLALAGSFMQILLRNPLADPYVLGISGGAAFFTLLLMFFGISEHWLLAGAWAGSLLTIMLILLLAKKHRWQSHALILSGVALACGFSAGISFILLMSPEASLRSMLFWLTGDLNDVQFPWLGLCIFAIGAVISLLLAPGLNILSRGEKEARALGLDSQKYRIMLYLLSSLLTATAVTLAGCIGFIGLIIPHFTRQLVGHDQRLALPFSMLLGGMLLIVADTLARTLVAPQQLPVGMLMTLIGVPVFVWMLQK